MLNRLFGLTYNNFGCVYKQNKDMLAAMESLKRALHYESLTEAELLQQGRSLTSAQIQTNSSGTILNICAILSKLGRHREAYEYAILAVNKLDDARSFL